jgi:SAM-dependent methyltransferase
VKLYARVMELVPAYRLWQAPFAEKKLAPLFQHNELAAARRVLDVGCGPGTNARHFAHADYIGIDNNPDYIAWARRRYGERFQVADVRDGLAGVGTGFDFVLVNSLLHHVETPDVRRILSQLASLLTDNGHVHILDLVMPDQPGLPRLIAGWDRGEHPRPLAQWRELFAEAFDAVLFEPYPLGAFRIPIWNMVYFKGKRKR